MHRQRAASVMSFCIGGDIDFHESASSQEDVAGLVGFFLHQRGSASSTSSFWGGPGCYTRPGLALNKGLPEYGFK